MSKLILAASLGVGAALFYRYLYDLRKMFLRMGDPRETMSRNLYLEDIIRDQIKAVCAEARDEGVIPTHAAVNPADLRRLDDFYGKGNAKPWKRTVYYVYYYDDPAHEKKIRRSSGDHVQVVADERIEEGYAEVVNAETAFVRGYIGDLPTTSVGEDSSA
jgi:hypothetical protein